jgi:hypothetical protein
MKIFVMYTLLLILFDEMGETCSTHGIRELDKEFWQGNLKPKPF